VINFRRRSHPQRFAIFIANVNPRLHNGSKLQAHRQQQHSRYLFVDFPTENRRLIMLTVDDSGKTAIGLEFQHALRITRRKNSGTTQKRYLQF
jgi:hypothetical protein